MMFVSVERMAVISLPTNDYVFASCAFLAFGLAKKTTLGVFKPFFQSHCSELVYDDSAPKPIYLAVSIGPNHFSGLRKEMESAGADYVALDPRCNCWSNSSESRNREQGHYYVGGSYRVLATACHNGSSLRTQWVH
jgi:hypothetical protein